LWLSDSNVSMDRGFFSRQLLVISFFLRNKKTKDGAGAFVYQLSLLSTKGRQ
jgi:hypothetical protein